MAKKKQQPLEPGDEVYRVGSKTRAVWVVLAIDTVGQTADIFLKNTDMQWFKYPLAKLTRAS